MLEIGREERSMEKELFMIVEELHLWVSGLKGKDYNNDF